MTERNWTDEDINALAETLENRSGHACRFDNVSAGELKEAVVFYQNINKVLCETKTTARKTIVVLIISGAIGVFLLGLSSKIKQAILP